MNNPKKLELELHLSQEMLDALKNCRNGILRLDFSIIDGEVSDCVSATLGPRSKKIEGDINGSI